MDRHKKANKEVNSRALHAKAVQVLVDEIGLEIQSTATLLKVSRTTIYNWIGGAWHPLRKDFDRIDALVKEAIKVKKDWGVIIEALSGSRYHEATKITGFKPRARKIIFSRKDDDEKIFALTALTFNSYAKEKERRND